MQEARNDEAAALANTIAQAYKAAAYSDDRAICQYDSPIYGSLQTALLAAIQLAYGLDEHWAHQVYETMIDGGESVGYSVAAMFEHLADEARGHAAHLAEYAYEAIQVAVDVTYAHSPRTREPFVVTHLDEMGNPAVRVFAGQLEMWRIIDQDRAAKRAEMVEWYTSRGYLVPELDTIYF